MAAIFAADVAGYSRLMEIDEDGTLRTLTGHREIMDHLVREHGGRIANTAAEYLKRDPGNALRPWLTTRYRDGRVIREELKVLERLGLPG